MMQMNLRVVSVDGMRIKTVRQWILRCMACYTTHTDMDRLFCSRCGVNHLSRVACSVDAGTGKLVLHLKSNYQVSTRGQKYSMPAPGKQGRFDGELLTREDQVSYSLNLSLNLSLRVYCSILAVSCFMWSGAPDSSGLLLS